MLGRCKEECEKQVLSRSPSRHPLSWSSFPRKFFVKEKTVKLDSCREVSGEGNLTACYRLSGGTDEVAAVAPSSERVLPAMAWARRDVCD